MEFKGGFTELYICVTISKQNYFLSQKLIYVTIQFINHISGSKILTGGELDQILLLFNKTVTEITHGMLKTKHQNIQHVTYQRQVKM